MPIVSGGSGGAGSGGVSLICTQTLLAQAASFDTQTILGSVLPTGYASLRAVILGRSPGAFTAVNVFLRFNNDSGLNYNYEQLDGTNAGATAGVNNSVNQINVGNMTGASSSAGMAGSCVIDIPNYNATTFNKETLSLIHAKTTGVGQSVTFTGGVWASTAAITRITLFPSTGNFDVGSAFSLYGLT